MAHKQTEFGTVAGITALVGVFPLLITLGIAQTAPSFGALALTAIHMGLMAGGAWAFAAWFGD